jgi:RNA-binding protein YhbY
MNSKERSELKGLAMNIETIINIGKSSLTPEVTEAVSEALEKRELVKIGVLKNCLRLFRSSEKRLYCIRKIQRKQIQTVKKRQMPSVVNAFFRGITGVLRWI